MTIHELMQWLSQYEWLAAGWFVALPMVTYIGGRLCRTVSPRLMRLFLAGAVYLAVVPGISMAIVVLYMAFVVRMNLLTEMHLVLHLLPVVSMLATLWAASRLAPFVILPGFNRLQGLMWLVGLAFAGLLFIHKTFIGIHFFARFEYLLVLLVVFLVVRRHKCEVDAFVFFQMLA